MSKLFARFVKDESGATAIEYGLIAALIALAIMVGAGSLGNSLNNQFNGIAGTSMNATAALVIWRRVLARKRPFHMGRPFLFCGRPRASFTNA